MELLKKCLIVLGIMAWTLFRTFWFIIIPALLFWIFVWVSWLNDHYFTPPVSEKEALEFVVSETGLPAASFQNILYAAKAGTPAFFMPVQDPHMDYGAFVQLSPVALTAFSHSGSYPKLGLSIPSKENRQPHYCFRQMFKIWYSADLSAFLNGYENAADARYFRTWTSPKSSHQILLDTRTGLMSICKQSFGQGSPWND